MIAIIARISARNIGAVIPQPPQVNMRVRIPKLVFAHRAKFSLIAFVIHIKHFRASRCVNVREHRQQHILVRSLRFVHGFNFLRIHVYTLCLHEFVLMFGVFFDCLHFINRVMDEAGQPFVHLVEAFFEMVYTFLQCVVSAALLFFYFYLLLFVWVFYAPCINNLYQFCKVFVCEVKIAIDTRCSAFSALICVAHPVLFADNPHHFADCFVCKHFFYSFSVRQISLKYGNCSIHSQNVCHSGKRWHFR